ASNSVTCVPMNWSTTSPPTGRPRIINRTIRPGAPARGAQALARTRVTSASHHATSPRNRIKRDEARRLLDCGALMRFPSSRVRARSKVDPDANFAITQAGGVCRGARRRITPHPVCDRFLRPARLRYRDSISADVRRAVGYRGRRDRTAALGLLDDAVHLRADARAAF